MKPERQQRNLDCTALNDYLRCPRMYFFSRIRHWVPEETPEHYAFGIAFHKGLEMLLRSREAEGDDCGYSTAALEQARKAFATTYRLQGLDPDKPGPKNLENGMLAMEQYVANYGLDDFRTLAVEHTGHVHIGTWELAVRIDAICRGSDGTVFVQEHKTSTKNSGHSEIAWYLALQVGAYNAYLAQILADAPETMAGVTINLVVFRPPSRVKKDGMPYARSGPGNEFVRIPVKLAPTQLEAWYATVDVWYKRLLDDWDRMTMLDDVSKSTMIAFPRNPQGCWSCRWLEYCMAWDNPLQVDDPPIGYVVEKWDPHQKKELT